MKPTNIVFYIFILICALPGNPSYAHQSGTSYLSISEPESQSFQDYTAQWKISVLDLELALGLDNNHDGKIVWGEILGNRERIEQFAQSRIQLSQNNGACSVSLNDLKIEPLHNGLYLVSALSFSCSEFASPSLSYLPMLGFNDSHKGLVSYVSSAGEKLFVLDKENDTAVLADDFDESTFKWLDFVIEGIWHIWIGYDHLLFLFALLIPSVLIRQDGKWVIQQEIRPVLVDTAAIVSTFTVAHSITLIAATMQWVELPTSWIEIIIAASVAAGGVSLLVPIPHRKRWLFVFLFGLIHGFGFANVLRELTESQSSFWQGTLGFNLGVEIGQLLIILLAVPLLYQFRKFHLYQKILLPVCAFLMIGTGSFWVIERSIA